MSNNVLASVLSLALIAPLAASADETLKFRGGIGVHPVSNVSGAANADGSFPNVTRNIVRGVNPAGQIWVITDLIAEVIDVRVKVDGRGLLLAGGNTIGTNAGAKVFATLMCANDGNVQHNSSPAGVPLAANGDFSIDDTLIPPPPSTCQSPVLLIRNAANLGWFAAGIPH